MIECIVGHKSWVLPLLSMMKQCEYCAWTGWLIGSRKAQIELAKASVACIHVEGAVGKGTGQLAWLVPPEWFLSDKRGDTAGRK